jgi:hypothetical protein
MQLKSTRAENNWDCRSKWQECTCIRGLSIVYYYRMISIEPMHGSPLEYPDVYNEQYLSHTPTLEWRSYTVLCIMMI